MLAMVTIPNGIKRECRKRFVALGPEGFAKLLGIVNNSLCRSLRKAKGAVPSVELIQRRYPSQRARPIVDAKLVFDLGTTFERQRAPKLQPQWLQATYDVFSKKRSNIQLAVGAAFPYERCQVVKTPAMLDYIAASWLACKPLIDVAYDKKGTGQLL